MTGHNPFAQSIMRSQNIARSNRHGVRRMKRRSNFAGGAGNEIPGIIKTGGATAFRPTAPLHKNMFSVTLKNADANNEANLVLSAGDYESEFVNRLLKEGTNNHVNLATDTVSMVVSSEIGVDGNNSWETIRNWIKSRGLYITNTRISVQSQKQLAKKLKIVTRDLMGDHHTDFISFRAEYNANQYHYKVIQNNDAYSLTRDKIVYYDLLGGEEVTFDFVLGGVLDTQAILEQAAIQTGSALAVNS
jgi:predicted phosphodiesterase